MPADPQHKTTICPRCAGHGALRVAEPECNDGRIMEPCKRCSGSGRVRRGMTAAEALSIFKPLPKDEADALREVGTR